ncbi:hypothetical protein [Borreliella bavariensis]|nr:hypothetical protein [Borreliella bavariensis]
MKTWNFDINFQDFGDVLFNVMLYFSGSITVCFGIDLANRYI